MKKSKFLILLFLLPCLILFIASCGGGEGGGGGSCCPCVGMFSSMATIFPIVGIIVVLLTAVGFVGTKVIKTKGKLEKAKATSNANVATTRIKRDSKFRKIHKQAEKRGTISSEEYLAKARLKQFPANTDDTNNVTKGG